ncbi:MAG: hypothetical protein KF712_17040 [Akkermansiaceae bacterium]|nr:hypothetical protein [Akkermansiaceae bacterium]
MCSSYFPRLAICAALAAGVLPEASGGTARFAFTEGSLSPVLTDLPAGVTVSDLNIGGGLDLSGNPDALRFEGGDTQNLTGTALADGKYLSFSITIAAGTAINLVSLTADYNSTVVAASYSNARVYSSIDGYDDVTADTIGIIGKTQNASSSGTNVLSFTNPASNTTVGGNITAGDFVNLTDRTVTFYFPWVDTGGAAAYTDLDNLTLNFTDATAPAAGALKVTDFRVVDGDASISFDTDVGGDYSVLASGDLTGPLYRKRWGIRASVGQSIGGVRTFNMGPIISVPRQFFVVTEGITHPVARIMPVGDSITEGSTGSFYSYRGPLYDKLRAAGFHFGFVGTRTQERAYTSPLYGPVTLNHLGQGGANAEAVRNNLAAAFPGNPADIVLIHSGHNFDLADFSESTIITRVENATRAMISTCRSVNPGVKILLAQVITSPKISEKNPAVVKYGYIPVLNLRLAEVAAELDTASSPVIIVNQAEGWNTQTDAIHDQVHPSQAGAEKMAVKWFNALSALLE